MNHYELMVIFSASLTEEEEKTRLAQVEEILTGQKATIHLQDHWGKRKLAYPIKKQRQGYYEWFYLEMEPDHVSEVDRKLKMDEQVLRFMILRMEKIQIQNMYKEIARRKEAAAAPQPEPVAETAEPAATQEPAAVETPAEPTPEA